MLKVWAWVFCLPLVLGNFSVPSVRYTPRVYTVEISGMKFLPAVIQVNKGDIIIWLNRDLVAHNVTEATGKAWASPVISAGQSSKMVATKSSTYFCSLHPVMKGRIQVK